MKKKILFYYPNFSDGGVEKTNLLISESLSKKYDIYFLSNSFSKKFDYEIKKKKIKKIKLSSSRTVLSFFELHKIFKKINPNIIFSVLTHANVMALAVNAFFFKNKLKIICCERLSAESYKSYFIKGKIIIFLAKFFYKNAKKIICNSKELCNEFKRLTKGNNVTHIYNPTLKLNFLSLSKKFVIKSKPFFPKEKPILFSLGRLDENKNHMMLLRAFNEIKEEIDCNIVIMGDGHKKIDLINYARVNNFRKKLFIYNFKKNPYPFFLKSDIFILTSNYEGLPNVLIEALVLKKYIISTNSPTGPKEILLNGKSGFLVKRNDYLDLSEKIKLFFYKRNFFLKKKKFYKKSLNQFSSKESLARYKKIVEEIVQ